MSAYSRVVVFLLCLAFGLGTGNTSLMAADHLSVHGRFLTTPCGDTVLLRGFNKMCVYESNRWGIPMMPDMKRTGANVLRIVWTTSADAHMIDTLDAVIQACIDNAMIPMVELHDATGDWSKLGDVVSYWLKPAMITMLNKHQAYLMINIANEAGDFDVTDAEYKTQYSGIVAQFRAAGLHMPLVIDADGYGQNVDAIINDASDIISADPDHNLMFSLHAYWQPKYFPNPFALFQTKMATVVAQGIPLIIGEFTGCYTDDPNSTDDMWKTLLPTCQQQRIGWIAWEWGPGNADYSTDPPTDYPKMDMTADGSYAMIKDGWSREVLLNDANSIAKTSVTCDYIKNKGVCLSNAVEPATATSTLAFVHYEATANQIRVWCNEPSVITIVDMVGRVVFQSTARGEQIVSVESWPAGLYLVRLDNSMHAKNTVCASFVK